MVHFVVLHSLFVCNEIVVVLVHVLLSCFYLLPLVSFVDFVYIYIYTKSTSPYTSFSLALRAFLSNIISSRPIKIRKEKFPRNEFVQVQDIFNKYEYNIKIKYPTFDYVSRKRCKFSSCFYLILLGILHVIRVQKIHSAKQSKM